jgi:hypothetical protein
LNRETTMAKRRPEASIFPSSAGIAGSGGDSIFNLNLFSVNLCLDVIWFVNP